MPPTKAARAQSRCTHSGHDAAAAPAKRTVSLPVVRTAPPVQPEYAVSSGIRPSRSGKRRAIVLATVQVLMIAHIVVWALSQKFGWFGGRTTTPIEPSESMEFTRDGVVNAGLIFFSIALLSTLVLGRWFCGWGCHVVLLQDLCGWMMKKVGVRPKPFRSRFLIYVPLLLALYMFIWPAAYRWGVLPAQAWLSERWSAIPPPPGPIVPWGFHPKLTTENFWATFPGVMVAIPFLFVCGFATVYFLGAKGFCTYGCPYGGFFAPLDKFAPGRIRVTDACEGCGHCTAVCTSNVRVHEEVREYGMVVDPGCMKCLDCVSVCPNDALYFGFGKPAVSKGPAKNETPVRKYDLSFGEEFFCAAVFLITFLSVRGVYHLVPMLMAAGVAGCITFMVWKCWRLVRDSNVTLHRFQLKMKGRLRRPGVGFAALSALAFLLVLHCGMINIFHSLGDQAFAKVAVNPAEVSAGSLTSVDDDDRRHAQRALYWYDRIVSIPSGGYGLTSLDQDQVDGLRARMRCVLNEFDTAERILREAFARRANETTSSSLARFLSDRSETAKKNEAIEMYERLLVQHPEYTFMLADYEPWAIHLGRIQQLEDVHRQRLERDPRNLPSLRALSILLMQKGQLDEGLSLNKRWIERDPSSGEAHRMRGLALADLRQMDQAIDEMRKALELAPHEGFTASLLADLLDAAGKTAEAAEVRRAMEH